MTLEEIRKELVSLPEADWVREMKEHYDKMGFYRASDLRRLLGNPKMGVSVGEEGDLSEWMKVAEEEK